LLAQAQHYAALPTSSVSQICVVNEFTLVLGDCAAAAGLLCSAQAAGALPAAARSRAPPPCDASPADVKLLRAQRAAAACSFLTSRSSRAVCGMLSILEPICEACSGQARPDVTCCIPTCVPLWHITVCG